MVDAVIKNAKVVLQDGIYHGGVAIDGGKIASLSMNSTLPSADTVIDAGDRYLLPGIVDIHTHIGHGLCPGITWEENLKTCSQIPAYGGVTTVFSFYQWKGSYNEVIGTYKDIVNKNSLVNVGMHPGIQTRQHAEEIPDYFRQGLVSYKFWFAYKGKEGEQLGYTGSDDGIIFDSWKTIAELSKKTGLPGMAAAHCENNEITFFYKEKLMKAGRTDAAAWTDSRPVFNEEESMSRAMLYSRVSGCPLYVVHTSIGSGVDLGVKAKAEGTNVTIETCPHYLTLTKDYRHPVNENLLKVNTPLRTKEDSEKLWWGIRQGLVECIGTDHATINLKMKFDLPTTGPSIWQSFPGWPCIETALGVMVSEGVNKDRITINKLVEVFSTNPAKRLGLYPAKGLIAPGSDADLVIVDLNRQVKVTPDIQHDGSDFTMWDGWTLKGWPTTTIVNGKVVMKDGSLVGTNGTGRYISRPYVQGKGDAKR